MKLEGLFTAVATPFLPSGDLDQEGLRANLRFQMHHEVNGIVVLGSTGEDPTLTSQEREKIVAIALEEVKNKALLFVGTGSYSTKEAIARTDKAKEMGADGALIVTPYYNKPTQEGLYLHYAAIASAVDLPICIYNIQGRTGQNLQTATLERLFSFPNIIGVKEGSCNLFQIIEVIAAAKKWRPDFKIMSSDDALTLPLMGCGGHGIISVVSNVFPGYLKNMVDAALQGDFKTAQDWHYQLLPFFNACFIETNPIPIKAAMNHLGMPAGPCRLPLCDLSESNLLKLHTVLELYASQPSFS